MFKLFVVTMTDKVDSRMATLVVEFEMESEALVAEAALRAASRAEGPVTHRCIRLWEKNK